MDITEYDEFYKWYKANERRFHCSQMTEVQIAYSAYLHGIEQSHKPVVMQAEGSDGAKGAAVASEGQGEANTCADCGRTKDEDGTCYSCEYGAMFGH